ncbi:hypothetical protein [Nocardia cyriacigeorgica]|uniref:hypothetical protein n=1 Tax=Nocardia cyriacigeorgica TaxID=135487 RepID=UPI0024575FCB|nr:hypothetical protein [Nocardia cyriacigeorgica]
MESEGVAGEVEVLVATFRRDWLRANDKGQSQTKPSPTPDAIDEYRDEQEVMSGDERPLDDGGGIDPGG